MISSILFNGKEIDFTDELSRPHSTIVMGKGKTTLLNSIYAQEISRCVYIRDVRYHPHITFDDNKLLEEINFGLSGNQYRTAQHIILPILHACENECDLVLIDMFDLYLNNKTISRLLRHMRNKCKQFIVTTNNYECLGSFYTSEQIKL